MFTLRLPSANGGRPEVFEVHEAQPIGLSDFSLFLSGGTNSFKVRIRGRVLTAPDEAAGVRWYELRVRFGQDLKHFALVPGGVLPPDFLLRGGTRVLMDRNVVSDLQKMPGVDTGAPHPLRWLDADGFHVNPILGAMEGWKQRPLSRNEFRSELLQVQQQIRQRLARANLVEFSGSVLQEMYEEHRRFVPRLKREQEFLRTISNRLADTVPARDLRKGEQFVLESAAKAGLRPLTLIVLTVLAKLYEGNQDRPAGDVLKLAKIKAAGQDWKRWAYNAIADVRQMELLSTGGTMPDHVAAMTGDVGLAQVWCGLRPTGVNRDDGMVAFGFHLDPALFPRLQGSTDDLIERIKAGDTVSGG